MKFAKSYLGLLMAVCACMFACTSENGGVAGTVTDTGNTIALGGVVTRTDRPLLQPWFALLVNRVWAILLLNLNISKL